MQTFFRAFSQPLGLAICNSILNILVIVGFNFIVLFHVLQLVLVFSFFYGGDEFLKNKLKSEGINFKLTL